MVPRLPVYQARARILRRGIGCRLVSTSPSPKITSVPFNLLPETALEALHPAGLLASATIGNAALAFLLRVFGPRVLDFAKEFGLGSDLRLRDIKAVYWPVWRVDLGADGVLKRAQNGQEGKAWVGIREGYVPGHSFAPLSYVSYAVPPVRTPLPSYEPDRDLKQLGEGFDIVPVPFEIAPGDVMDKIRSEIGRRAEWEGYKIDERDWSERDVLLGCYPMYFPIYVADFEHRPEGFGPEAGPGEGRRITIVMDAHDEKPANCRVNMPMPPQAESKDFFFNPAPFLPTVSFVMPAASSLSSAIAQRASPTSPSYASILAAKYQEFMIPPRPAEGATLQTPLTELRREINWEDARIQNWNGSEREDNEEYLIKAGEYAHLRGGIETLKKKLKRVDDQGRPIDMAMVFMPGSMQPGNFGLPSFKKRPMGEVREEMEGELKRKQAEMEECRPKWWREWADKTHPEKK